MASSASPHLTPATPRFADVSGLLYPRSIAVIGASDRPGNLGGDTVERLLRFGYPGRVFAVNPSGGTVRGVTCHRTMADLPEAPHSAVMSIPAAAVVDTVRDCIAVGTRLGVAFAGGFAETGAEGAALQRDLVALCQETGFTLCGPNCVGIINAATPATQSFATALHEFTSLRAGPISMVTQSGGIGTTAFSMVQWAGFGFRHLISGGNEAVVDFADYLHALACDEGTEVIAAYLEGAGDGAKLVNALEAARDRGKPVVMIKSGATAASARAAQAHTGSLVGVNRVFDAVLQELGVIRVRSVEELVDVSLMLAGLAHDRLPRGNGVGIVTFGGGNGVLAADQCTTHGLEAPPLDAAHSAKLRPLLLSVASAANPMDLTPSTAFRAESLAQLPVAMDVLASQPDISSVILIVGAMASRAQEISQVFIDFVARCPKPVCVSWPAPPTGTEAHFAEHGIPSFDEPDRGLRALGHLARLAAAMSRPRRGGTLVPVAFDWAAHVPAATSVVPEDGCHAILRAAGLPAAAGALATSAAEAQRIAAGVGLPVVLKGITPRITHRAAAGLLAVDLRTEDDVAAGFRRLADRATVLGVTLDGVLVQRMARGGTELLVSAFADPVFGPMISVGAGGGLTELLEDVVTARAPVDEAVAANMIGRLRLATHARDEIGPLDRSAPAAFVARLSLLCAGAPWPRFTFEVNPIRWNRAEVVAVDGLLVIER
ncbi:MAG TPA: acetate--CoA ligase family protein [Acetobacteraceae bacterium]|jgi:acyl-CoA synthetase (NDP forming)|nr:acetate--CoA ligase family protein [Acetobacteraceae bacterium]